jgi:hypothetical protein
MLKDLLFEGFPVGVDLILHWKKPIGDLMTIGNPKLEKWKRWHQDRDEYYGEIAHTRLLWNNVQVPTITSIKALQIEFENAASFFKGADLYFSSSLQLEKELTNQFGEPYIHRTEFEDKDGTNEHIQKQWILTFPDSKIKIQFLLDSQCKVIFKDETLEN